MASKDTKSGQNVKATRIESATTAAAPRIFSFSPTSGPPGTVVTIVGQNFVNVQNVLFAGRPAGFAAVSTQEIEVGVPARAKTGSIVVRTKHGKAEGPGAFVVTSGNDREGAPPVRDPGQTK